MSKGNKQPRVKSSKKRTFAWSRVVIIVIVLCFMILGATVMFAYEYIFKNFPSPDNLSTVAVPQTTKIFDRNGQLLYNIYVDQNRTLVPLRDIPVLVQEATISIEDKDFYKHKGVDPIGGIARALKQDLSGGSLQGGSTITQQLVKTLLLSPERTVTRKIKEIILAYLVELKFSKDQILEMYLNNVPYGGTAWGIEAASERYFGKTSKDLDLAQASFLAGLPAAPTYYSPYGSHPEMAKARQKLVLNRMVEDTRITKDQADTAAAEELIFKPDVNNIKAPHFVAYVKEQLVNKYGEKQVEQGGLRVTTTLDLPLQEYAQDTVASEVAKLAPLSVSNGASLVTRPATGEILAMVGSKDYFDQSSGNFNVTTGLRQPGSAIKPINYAIGLENKIVTPASLFIDTAICFPTPQGQYCPHNYDGQFHGPVQLRFALANSYNIPAVKMLKMNTVETMVASASAWGITTFNDPGRFGLALTLGGGEVPMTEMAQAFGVFANTGVHKNLVSILKVTDSLGHVLEEYKDANLGKETPSALLIPGNRVISPETAFLISHILLDPGARAGAFGAGSQLVVRNHPGVSVKTGTTDDKRDNWTIGFTPEVVVATWVGNNDNSPMNQYLASGVTGAAPIWNKIMSHFLEDKKESWPRQPEGIVGVQVCALDGGLPTPDNPCPTRFEYFIKGTQPKGPGVAKQAVFIDKGTGKLAAPNQTDNVEPQEKLIVRDPFTQYCLDCAQ
jgi:penicillin-binding protein 1C